MARKKKIEIPGGWFPTSKDMLKSEVYRSLSDKAVRAYQYFIADKKSDCQEYVSLTFDQAKENGICGSKDTFLKTKQELIDRGFLDSIDGGGMGKRAVFKLSGRWKKYGTSLFINQEYLKGFCPVRGFKKKCT